MSNEDSNSGMVHTNFGMVPEFQRKARQKLEGYSTPDGKNSDFLFRKGSLLPTISVPAVNVSLDSAGWKKQAGLPSICAVDSSPAITGDFGQEAPHESYMVKSQGTLKWGERQSFLGEMDLDRREKELALMRNNQQEANKLLLESWLNDVLDTGPRNGVERSARGKSGINPSCSGLSSYGLSRAELASMGLVGEQIDRLYRSLYVYTVGFHDSLRSLFKHCKHPGKLLSNVWSGYINIADAAIQVGFKSEFLSLVAGKTRAASQLLMAEEALAAARQDQAELEKSNTWLTGAHSEERSMRQALEKEIQSIRVELERERNDHKQMLDKFLTAAENAKKHQEECRAAKDEIQRLTLSVQVAGAELAGFRSAAQQLEAAAHAAEGEAKEAKMLEAQARAQHEADKARIADLNKRLAAAWKEAEQLRAELQEEAFSRKNIMDDIRIKQQTIAEQEAIIADHVAFRHRHQQQMDDLKQKIQEADKMKEDLEGERLETRGQIDQLRAEVDAVEERLATKRMKKRAYKRNMLQLQIEHENVKRAYMHHDQDRERERERMHDIENQLSDKIQECTEKETSMYVLAHGVSSTVPLVWKLEAAIAYLRKELAASRAGVASLTAVVAERDEQILTKAKEIMGLFRQIRGLESVVEELRDRTRELEVQLDDTKRALADEEAQHKTDNVKHFKQIDKLEIALKAGRNAQEKLRSELAASKGETSSASRKLAAAEAAIQKTLEEQKSWRTDKYALEDRIAQADEKRLEAEKELIKVRGEMQNYHNEYLNTKKLLGMSRMAQEADNKAAETSLRQLSKAKDDIEALMNFLQATIGKFKDLAAGLGEGELNNVRQVAPMKEDFQTVWGHIKTQNNLSKETISRLQTEREGALRRIASMEQAATEQQGKFQEQLDGVRREMQRLMESEAARRAGMGSENDELVAKLEEEARQKERYISKCEENEAAIKGLQGDISHLTREKMDLQAILTVNTTKHEEETQKLAFAIMEVQSQLKAEKESHAETASKLGNAKDTVAARNMSIAQTKMRILKLEDQVKELNGQLRNANSVRSYLQAELGRVQEAKAKAAAAVRQLTELADHQKAELQCAHILLNTPDKDKQMEKFKDALKEKSDELIEVTNRLNDEIEAKDSKIGGLEKQLVNVTNELEDAQGALKEAKAALEAANGKLMSYTESMNAKVEGVRKELLEEMRAREEKLHKQLARARLAAEKAAEQYARETAERDFKSSLQSMEMETVPSLRSGRNVVPSANRRVRAMAQTEFLLKQTLSEVVFATAGPSVHLGQLEFRPVTLLVIVGEIILKKSQIDLELLQARKRGDQVETQTVEEFTYDYFLRHFGARRAVEAVLQKLVNAILAQRYKYKRLDMFGRLLGLYDPLPEDGTRFYVNAVSALHEGENGFRHEHNEGHALVTARTVLAVASDLFVGCRGKGAELTRKVLNHVDEKLDGQIDIDVVLEWFIAAWEAEMMGLETRLLLGFQEMLITTGQTGLEYAKFKQAVEDSLDVRDQKVVKALFRDVSSWIEAGNELTEDTILDVLQDHGLLGLKGAVSKLPQRVLNPTKYDSFLLMEDSWKAISHELAMQTPKLARQPELSEEIEGLQSAIAQLEGILRMRAQVDLASGWALFRRIVAFFVIHQTRLEVTDTEKLIANPRLGELRQTKLPASQHRRVMYGQSPLKQRMMNAIKEQNLERIEKKMAITGPSSRDVKGMT